MTGVALSVIIVLVVFIGLGLAAAATGRSVGGGGLSALRERAPKPAPEQKRKPSPDAKQQPSPEVKPKPKSAPGATSVPGRATAASSKPATAASPKPAVPAIPKPAVAPGPASDRVPVPIRPEDVATLLAHARKVVLVPGYGLAVAQAQRALRDLADALKAGGVEVLYAVHPLAGRMPGHLNVVLADADVPFEALTELDDVNPEFATTDVALVVGADDIVNPAARTEPSARIYGMPILEVSRARRVVVLKRSMRPGFAGVENELLFDPGTAVLFGDAADGLSSVLGALTAR
jgi:hypothetical protein